MPKEAFDKIKAAVVQLDEKTPEIDTLAKAEDFQIIRKLFDKEDKFGGVDFNESYNAQSILSNDEAVEIQLLAINKILSAAIEKVDTAKLLNIANGDNEAVYTVLHKEADFGNIDLHWFHDEGKLPYDALRQQATQRLINSQINFFNKYTELNAIVSAKTPEDVRQALEDNKATLFPGLTSDLTDAALLSAKQVKDIHQQAHLRVLELNRIAPLENITLTIVKNQLLEYAKSTPGFKPSAGQVAQFNKELASLPANAKLEAIDAAIQKVWPDNTAHNPPGNLLRSQDAKVEIKHLVGEQNRIADLFKITSPSLRAVLVEYALRHDAFKPTEGEVVALNAAVATATDVAAIDAAIQNEWPAATAGNPSATVIDSQETTVKDAIVEEVQLVAKIKAEINQFSEFSSSAYPVLIQLIKALPVNKQQALLADNAAKLNNLLSATDRHQYVQALRECGIVSSELVGISKDGLLEKLVDEAQRQKPQQGRIVYNYAVDQILKSHGIEVDLSDDESKKLINNIRVSNWKKEFVDPLIDHIKDKGVPLDAAKETALRDSFLETQNENNIKAQRRSNDVHWINNYDKSTKTIGENACFFALLGMKKIASKHIEKKEFDQIYSAFKSAGSYETFVKMFCEKDPVVGTLNRVFGAHNWKKMFTKDLFEFIARKRTIEEKYSDDDTVKKSIAKQSTIFQSSQQAFNKLTKADSKIFAEMDRLSNLSAVAWLAQGTEAFARQNAAEVLDGFEKIGKTCEQVCRDLAVYKKDLQKMLDSLPTQDEMALLGLTPKTINKQREKLERELGNVNKMLERYQDLHLRLHGNPLHNDATGTMRDQTANKGILAVLKEAKQQTLVPAKDLPTMHVMDRSEEKTGTAKLLGDLAYKGDPSTASLTSNKSASGVFQKFAELPPTKVRVHMQKGVMLPDRKNTDVQVVSESAYSERQEAVKTVAKNKGGTEIVKPVTFTVVKPPQATKEQAQDPTRKQQELNKAKVEFYTNMAANFLARIGKIPTAEDPIVLRGNDAEQLAMLWTALVELGKADKVHGFDEKAIKVESMAFQPSSQKGMLYGYSKDSYYNQYFKDAQTGEPMRTMQGAIKKYYTETSGVAGKSKDTLGQQDFKSLYKHLTTDKVQEGLDATSKLNPRAPSGP